MTTSIAPEPIYIGGQAVYVKFFMMPRDPGEPPRIEGVLTLVGGEGVLTLDALVGPQGIPGEPSPIIRPQWGSTVTVVGDLPDPETLDETDDGRAWYIAGQWHVYSSEINDYHVIQGSIPGPPGATPTITVTAEQVEPLDPVVYGPITVTPSGPSTARNFHIQIPGVPGPEGPASQLRLAADYDNTDDPDEGDVPTWNEGLSKWQPKPPAYIYPKYYSIPHQLFTDYSGGATRQLIASRNLPAEDYDAYIKCTGHVQIQRGLLSPAQVEVEVRVGVTGASTGEMEPLFALGPYDPSWALLDAWQIANISPHFSDPSNPTASISPESMTGRVLAGTAVTVYVFLHNITGFGGYLFLKAGGPAQLDITVTPVAGS